MDCTKLPYRMGVGIMLINKDGKVFVGKRIDTSSEEWQMPQGGIDEGEDELPAALRELEEETGTGNASLVYKSKDYYYYDLPDELIPTVWGGKYRGQKQRWFAFLFEGSDEEINLQTEHPEFCQWQWIDAEKLPDVIVSFKKVIYLAILEEFRNVIKKVNAAA